MEKTHDKTMSVINILAVVFVFFLVLTTLKIEIMIGIINHRSILYVLVLMMLFSLFLNAYTNSEKTVKLWVIYVIILVFMAFLFIGYMSLRNDTYVSSFETEDHKTITFYHKLKVDHIDQNTYQIVIYQKIFPFIYAKLGEIDSIEYKILPEFLDETSDDLYLIYSEDGFTLYYEANDGLIVKDIKIRYFKPFN